MNLGLILTIGGSIRNMAISGQDELFKKFYLNYFAKHFDNVYVFSYEDEKTSNLPSNVFVIPNKLRLHRYMYGFLMPFLNLSYFQKCDVFRVYHLLGTPPAIISKIFFNKPFIFNFAYNYEKFALIENKKMQALLFKILQPFAVFFATKIFAATKKIQKRLPSDKTIYLPNGVDVDVFKPGKRRRFNASPTVLSVGRLEKQKNFESLIRAMKGIKAELMIVGQGSLKIKLENLAKGIQVILKIIDKVPHSQMPAIYNKADIFISPSLAEGSPKVLLEAMACGLPVIGSDVEGTDELIKDGKNGFLYDGASTNLSKKISTLCNNYQLIVEVSKNARETVVGKFDVGKLNSIEVKSLKKVTRS